jgi:hypothetical protein
MKLKAQVRALLLALAVGAVAAAAQMSAVPWPQEPETVLGIKLGQPLKASMKICPRIFDALGNYLSEWPTVKYPCFDDVDSPLGLVVHNIAGFTSVTVALVDGKVRAISASFLGTDADTIESALVEKFGTPHFSTTAEVRNLAGATRTNRGLSWIGHEVGIQFQSVGPKFFEGTLAVVTQTYIARTQKDKADREAQIRKSF